MSLLRQQKKAHGAYYTSAPVAEFLTRWAVRSPDAKVLDPSAGAGVFLSAAVERVRALGGHPELQVTGVELLAETCDSTRHHLEASGSEIRLLQGDFFQFEATDLGQFDAVVGNPPFIRYHRFTGDTRSRALLRARDAGVQLSALTSSWAPFLVHAISFLGRSGRLAVVTPAELAHASYAQPVIQLLCSSFQNVALLTFDKKLFPDLSEDTVLVLGEGRGHAFQGFTIHRFRDSGELRTIGPSLPGGIKADASQMASGAVRMTEYLIPGPAREIYRALRTSSMVARLGQIGDVGIGYVTGDNEFFHLTPSEARRCRIPTRFLREVVRRGSDLPGILFTKEDWTALRRADGPNYLLWIQPDSHPLPQSVRQYLRRGRQLGVPERYKCRVRSPWYAVPHVYKADAFLTYMSGSESRLVANGTAAAAPNTLHIARLRRDASLTAEQLAAVWCSTLCRLSCEIEGHSLGGGLLKLEPGEAANVLVPLCEISPELVLQVDAAVRSGSLAQAADLIDPVVGAAIGHRPEELALLRESLAALRRRRTKR